VDPTGTLDHHLASNDALTRAELVAELYPAV
jgi:hypothetical protein